MQEERLICWLSAHTRISNNVTKIREPLTELGSHALEGCVHRKGIEAFHGIRWFDKDLEKAIHLCQFENDGHPGRNCCQFDVAISFHRFSEATQKHIDARAIQMARVGKIKHQIGPLTAQKSLYFLKELF